MSLIAPITVTFSYNGTTVDVSDHVRDVQTSRGKSQPTDSTVPAGTATLTVDDSASIFDPDNTSGPLYGMLMPGKATVAISHNTASAQPSGYSTTYVSTYAGAGASNTVGIFCGTIESLTRTWPGGAAYSETVITLVDNTKQLSQLKPKQGTVLNAQLPGKRIAQLLALQSRGGSSWTPFYVTGAYSALNDGSHMLGPITLDGSTSLWDYAAAAASSDGGMLFVDEFGRVTFHDLAYRLNQLSPVVTFGDQTTQVPVTADTAWRIADDNLIQDAAYADVTGLTGTYGPSGFGQMASGGDATQLSGLVQTQAKAHNRYSTYSVPLRGAETVTMDVLADAGDTSSTSAYEAVQQVGIDSLVKLQRTPPGGGSMISDSYYVVAVSHAITDTSWTCTYRLANARISAFIAYPTAKTVWQLGTSHLNSIALNW